MGTHYGNEYQEAGLDEIHDALVRLNETQARIAEALERLAYGYTKDEQ